MSTNMLALPYRPMVDRVIIALLTSPFAVNKLRNETKNKKYFDKLLYSLLPADVGIEIEVPYNSRSKIKLDATYDGYYEDKCKNVIERIVTLDMHKKSLLKGVNDRPLKLHVDGNIPEITHHMPKGKLYKHIWAIFETLNSTDVVANQGGSIHYHIDVSKFINFKQLSNCRGSFGDSAYHKMIYKNKNLMSLGKNINKIMLRYFDFIVHTIFDYKDGGNHFHAKRNSKTPAAVLFYLTAAIGKQSIQPRIDEFGTVEFRMSKCILNYTRIMKEILIAQLLIACAKKGGTFDYKKAKKIYNYSKNVRRFETAA